MKGFTQLSLAAFVAYASATAISVEKSDSPLSVVLTASGNTEVKVAVTNKGDKSLNLLSKGTFLDEVRPVEKVTVYSSAGSKKVPFEGIKLRLKTSGLKAEDFVALAVGETKEVTVETAALHSLSAGGNFDVFAQGSIPYAEAGSTELAGSVPYESNKLSMAVDGAKAATVAKALSKRTAIGDSCSGDRLATVQTALSNCQSLASSAASAASSGTKLSTYFKSTSSSTKKTVAARLRAVASDCGSSGSTTTTNCNDPYNGCDSNVLAYTVPSDSFITYCDIFFTDLPDISNTCHGQDQATTVIHEETHADAVYSPGTDDLGYGYDAASKLSASKALLNADTYALYSNAIYLNC